MNLRDPRTLTRHDVTKAAGESFLPVLVIIGFLLVIAHWGSLTVIPAALFLMAAGVANWAFKGFRSYADLRDYYRHGITPRHRKESSR